MWIPRTLGPTRHWPTRQTTAYSRHLEQNFPFQRSRSRLPLAQPAFKTPRSPRLHRNRNKRPIHSVCLFTPTNIRAPHGCHPQAPPLPVRRRRQRGPPPLPPSRGPRPPPRRQAPPRHSPAPALIACACAGVLLIASSCFWRRRGRRGRAVLRARLEAPRAPVPPAEEGRGGQVSGALRSVASKHRSAHRVPQCA